MNLRCKICILSVSASIHSTSCLCVYHALSGFIFIRILAKPAMYVCVCVRACNDIRCHESYRLHYHHENMKKAKFRNECLGESSLSIGSCARTRVLFITESFYSIHTQPLSMTMRTQARNRHLK